VSWFASKIRARDGSSLPKKCEKSAKILCFYGFHIRLDEPINPAKYSLAHQFELICRPLASLAPMLLNERERKLSASP
jgi:hypothetical protein